MKSRAELLAEIEEKRLENNNMPLDLNGISIAEPEARGGYDPYDHPGRGKVVRDSGDIIARRRAVFRRLQQK